jgi:hypothetical protein
VDLADGGRRHRPAADAAAAAQLRVEAVQRGGVEPPQWQVAERRQDGALDVALVGDPGAPGQVGHPEPALEQLGEGRIGRRSPALVDLGEQSGTEGLGLALGPGRAGEVATFAGEWVAAGVDDDLPGVASLADEAPCHAREGRALTPVDKSF